jgi:hypothetical protein
VLIATTVLTATAQATIIGEIDLTGNFTLNHTFDFNHPQASPFGTFGNLTVQSATGIFGSYVAAGDVLAMNTTFMYVSNPLVVFGPPAEPMTWSIGGFTIATQWDNITGADFVGQNCLGITDLSGNGFDPYAYPFYPSSYWNFTAPPYDITNFPTDITGPLNMTVAVGYDNHHVPDSGATALLLAIGIIGVGALRRKLVARAEQPT